MKKMLVVYYSWSNGNTERIAKQLAEKTGADLLAYDVIAIGTPTWWYTMAPAVRTFLTTHDFAGKTVIPFMTNGGWPGRVIKDMKTNCKGAEFAHEMQIRFDSMGKDHLETPEREIEEWVEKVKQELR